MISRSRLSFCGPVFGGDGGDARFRERIRLLALPHGTGGPWVQESTLIEQSELLSVSFVGS